MGIWEQELATLYLQALSDGVAQSAVYTPTTGPAVTITVFFKKEHMELEEGPGTYDVYIRALTSDIGAALPGETILVNGTTYKIKDPPRNNVNVVAESFVTLSED